VNPVIFIKSVQVILHKYISGDIQQKAYLWQNADTIHKQISLSEDTKFQIVVETTILPADDPPQVALHSIELPIYYANSTGDSTFWESELNCHLLNYIGISSLTLVHSCSNNIYDTFTFESLASKFNELQVEQLLNYLAKKESDIVRLCFSKTTATADSHSSDWIDATLLLQIATDIVAAFSKNRSYLLNRHKSRLIPTTAIVNTSEASLNDHSLMWLLNNLDRITPTSQESENSFPLNGKFYTAKNIEQITLAENPDVPENQVLYGLLKSILKKLSLQLEKANSAIDESKKYKSGSLQQIMQRCLPANITWKKKCLLIIKETIQLIRFFDAKIPVSYKGELLPKITPFVRSNSVYKQLFMLAHKWYTAGTPTWQGQEYLASLLSVDKLYELFSLLQIIDILNKLGYHITDKNHHSFMINDPTEGHADITSNGLPFNCYNMTNGIVEVRILYEPTIYPYHKDNKHQRIVDLSHSGTGTWKFRQPDFLISITKDRINYEQIIMDSKYSRTKTVMERHLPSIANKYLLGFGFYTPGKQFIDAFNPLGVIAIYPGKNESTNHSENIIEIRKGAKNLRMPVIPIIAGIELSPEKDSHLVNTISTLLEISRIKLS
jgi:hypothetical protein